jgi:hypothetical protein
MRPHIKLEKDRTYRLVTDALPEGITLTVTVIGMVGVTGVTEDGWQISVELARINSIEEMTAHYGLRR